MKNIRYPFFIVIFCFFGSSVPLAAQVNGWDLIKGLIELSENAAKLSDKCFQLTEDRMWAGGCIYYPAKIDLASNFNMELEVFFGCKDTEGADGIVFIFSPKMAMGREGEGMGFGGVSPSIGIELDTYQNDHLGDPAGDHIAILQNGINHHSYGLTKPVTVQNIEDCKNHQLQITWDAMTKKIAVALDGKPILSLEKDIVQEVFDGESEVFWGVAASTGGKSNEQKVCFERINFRPASAIANSSFKKIESALLDGKIIPLENTSFPTGQVQLTKDSQKELDELVAFLRSQPTMHLGIYGHTDSTGDAQNNKHLSQRRVDAIASYLVSKGIPQERLLARGVGEQYPITDNDTETGRQRNRRIEIYLFKPLP